MYIVLFIFVYMHSTSIILRLIWPCWPHVDFNITRSSFSAKDQHWRKNNFSNDQRHYRKKIDAFVCTILNSTWGAFLYVSISMFSNDSTKNPFAMSAVFRVCSLARGNEAFLMQLQYVQLEFGSRSWISMFRSTACFFVGSMVRYTVYAGTPP